MDTSSPEAQVAPDNWEDHSVEINNADGDDEMSKSFSKLNVDAPPFVPSFATLQMAQLDPPEKGNEDSPSGKTAMSSGHTWWGGHSSAIRTRAVATERPRRELRLLWHGECSGLTSNTQRSLRR